VRQGTREGARQAAVSTKPVPSSGTWASNGCVTSVSFATNPDGYDLVCYVKQRMGLNQTDTRVKVTFKPCGGASPCATKQFAAGQPVTICTQYPAKSLSGFMSPFLSGRILASKVTIRIEQDSTWVGQAPSAAPTLSGVEEPALTSWPMSCNNDVL
jgi:hypothetical protein